jgi:hypothetical protein
MTQVIFKRNESETKDNKTRMWVVEEFTCWGKEYVLGRKLEWRVRGLVSADSGANVHNHD